MNYHLHHQGQDLGVFSLEELRRRRQAGELSGDESVWCEGMADWQSLDTVLSAAAASSPSPTPPPVPSVPPASKSNKTVLWVTGGVIVLVAGLWMASLAAVRYARRAPAAGSPLEANEGTEVARQKIASGAKSRTEADARRRSKEFRVRQWLQGYKADGNRAAGCDALAIKAIEAWIESNFGKPGTNGPPVWEMCDSLAGLPGCNDPLVLTVAALNATEVHEKIQRLERALNGFASSSHKAYPRFSAVVSLLEEVGTDQDRYRALFPQAMQTLRQCFRDGSFRPDDQEEVAEILINGWGNDLVRRARQGLEVLSRQGGPGFDWISLILAGEFHINQAWRARGSGFADSVSEEGWKNFKSHLSIARTNLTQAWKLRPDLPLAPCRMIYVAMGESNAQEMRTWFDRTLAAQIDYPRAWTDMRWGLRPRWHGSLEAMLALGKLAVETKRFDTDVPRKLFDVVSDLESELGVPQGEHIYGREDIWPYLQQMYEGYLAEPSAEADRAEWRRTYALVAYLAGKYDAAKAQLDALNGEAWPTPSGWGTDLTLMPLEVAARTGPLSSRVAEAEASYRARAGDALPRYQALKEEAAVDERTAKFVAYRLAALALEKQLQSGAWVELLPKDDQDPAWVIVSGKIRRLGDGALEVESDKFGHMLYSRARLGTNFEVKGEFEVGRTTTDAFQAGLVMGLPNKDDTDWYGLLMKNNEVDKQMISFNRGWSARQIQKPAALNSRTNSFHFRFQNGKASASINGQEIFPATEPARGMRIAVRDFLVGLGAYNDMNETVIRYRRVQVRRL
jgi:hypothetical protein